MGDGAVQLEPCAGCGRHVRVTEGRCPFCGTALDFGNVEPQLVPTGRLSRGALFSFRTLVGAGVLGATTSALFTACSQPLYGLACTENCDPVGEDAGTVDGDAETSTAGSGGVGGQAGVGGADGEGGR